MADYSTAARARWKNVPKKVRRERMTERAKEKWANLSPAERVSHIKKMTAGRKAARLRRKADQVAAI